jgi:para-nitrobenzyl esterase
VWSKADCKSTYFTEKQAQKVGAQYAKKVGCGNVADVAACLRKVPVEKLVEAGGQFVEPTAGGTIGPIVNGTTLTMSPVTAFVTGHVNHEAYAKPSELRLMPSIYGTLGRLATRHTK